MRRERARGHGKEFHYSPKNMAKRKILIGSSRELLDLLLYKGQLLTVAAQILGTQSRLWGWGKRSLWPGAQLPKPELGLGMESIANPQTWLFPTSPNSLWRDKIPGTLRRFVKPGLKRLATVWSRSFQLSKTNELGQQSSE